jgi:hypothetical protein
MKRNTWTVLILSLLILVGTAASFTKFSATPDAWLVPVRYSGNPIINYGGGGWENSQVEEPIVFIDPSDSTKTIMFYSGVAAPLGSGTISIGRATGTVASPYTWTQYASNPIFTDSGASIRLDSMQLVGGTYFLYYTKGSGIFLATSTDGFTFAPQGEVLTTAGCSDENVVSQGAVLHDSSGTWGMYYSYRTNGGVILPGIRYATSSNGTTWSKSAGSNCADLLNVAPGYVEWHQIQKIGSSYVLSYEYYNQSYWAANLAYSATLGGVLTQSLVNPLFKGNGVEENHVATPAYYQIGGAWYLFYQYSLAGFGGFTYINSNWAMGQALLPNGNSPLSGIP